MRKKILAAALALAMCLGLMGTSLAAEEEHSHEGYDAVSVDFGDAVYKECDPKLQVYTGDSYQGGILDTGTNFWSFEGKGYQDVKPGGEITVTNVGTDPSSYVYVYLWRYNYYSSSQKQDIWLAETETFRARITAPASPLSCAASLRGTDTPGPMGKTRSLPLKRSMI